MLQYDSLISRGDHTLKKSSTSDGIKLNTLKNTENDSLFLVGENPDNPYSAWVVMCDSAEASTCEKILDSIKFAKS